MNRDSNKQSAIILAVIGILPVVWLGLLIAPSVKGGLPEILPSLLTVFNDPFHIELCGDSLKTVLVLLLLYGMGIGIYLSTRRNYRRREEHGSAKWGSAKAIDKKYRQSPPSENKLMTQNVRIGLNAKKHRRNLNTLVCGGSGAGKTRFYCKPNLMQTSNSSQVILDPKGEILRDVGNLLEKAGYEIRDFRLVDKKSKKPFELTLLLDNAAFDRLALSYAQNLKVLGIRLRIEKVDSARYGDLVRNFDYDMIVGVVPQSLYPGNEQRYYFGSKAANIKGSKNYAGISDEVVDDLIERLIKSHDYQDRLSLVRALDRVLSWGFYVIPHFYMPAYRIAYWKHIKMPEKSPPYGLNPYIWWDENLGK